MEAKKKMSNLILTHSCNKGCSYCFARDVRNEDHDGVPHMSLDTLKKIIQKIKKGADIRSERPHIKLLGGEPTQHPHFKEILDYLHNEKVPCTLISNFLFSEEILNVVLKYVEVGNIQGFLVNATELDKNNRIEIFKKNYNTIYDVLYAKDRERHITCGLTIDKDTSTDYYLNYLDFLMKHLITIEEMRLSLSFPGQKEHKNDFYFLNNTDFGDKLVFIVHKLLSLNVPAHLDCIQFPCMYKGKEERKFMEKFFRGSNKPPCGRKSGPTDYFPDETAIYCYPNKDIKVDTSLFDTNIGIEEALRMKYQIARSMLKLPEACEKCGFRKSGACDGPCVGFFDLSEVKKNL